MLKNKVALSLVFALYSVSGFAQDWKSVADSQLELQVLLLAKEKAELEKKNPRSARARKATESTRPTSGWYGHRASLQSYVGSDDGHAYAREHASRGEDSDE